MLGQTGADGGRDAAGGGVAAGGAGMESCSGREGVQKRCDEWEGQVGGAIGFDG